MVDLFSLSIRSSQIILSLFTGIGSIWSSSVPGVWEFEPYLAGVGNLNRKYQILFFALTYFCESLQFEPIVRVKTVHYYQQFTNGAKQM